MAVYVLQGFVGYPLTSICLKKEGYSVLKQYRQGTWKAAAVKEKANDDSAKNYLFPQIPDKYKSDFTYLFTMVILTVMSGYLDKLSGGYISKFVWALILGVFATAMGFIEKNVLVRSRSMGFVYTIIGLILFLTGVNVGFAPVGNLLGSGLGSGPLRGALLPIGMLIGYYIVKAEPAVQVLNEQVEEITGGTISRHAMNRALQAGVAVAVALAMLLYVRPDRETPALQEQEQA